MLDFLGTKTGGTDLYVSATKLLLDKSLLLNTTLRYTNASKTVCWALARPRLARTAAACSPVFDRHLLRHNLAVGAEYRFKPNNLQALGAAAGLGAALRGTTGRMFSLPGRPAKRLAHAGVGGPVGRIVPGVTRTSAKPVTTFRPRSRSDRAGFHLLGSTMSAQLCAWAVAQPACWPCRRRANSLDPLHPPRPQFSTRRWAKSLASRAWSMIL